MLWWVKRSLMAGMNAQVLHGASYSGAYHGKLAVEGNVPGTKWPGFEAFRKAVSNYWNRTPSVVDARGCLDAIARMNVLFGKTAKVDCAIYRAQYQDTGEGDDDFRYPDGGLLSSLGYSYEFVSPELLELDVCRVEDGLLDKAGVGYRCLIIPEQTVVSGKFLRRIKTFLNDGLPVIWIGKRPVNAMFYAEWSSEEKRGEWERLRNEVWEAEGLFHLGELSQVPALLKDLGIRPRIETRMETEEIADIITATRQDDGEHVTYYMIYRYNRVRYTPDEPNPDSFGCSGVYHKGTAKPSYVRPGAVSRKTLSVSLLGEGAVYACNPWSGKLEKLPFEVREGRMEGTLCMEEDELVMLAVFEQERDFARAVRHSEREAEISARDGESFGRGVNDVQGAAECGSFTGYEWLDVTFSELKLQEFVPDRPEETSFLRSHFSEEAKWISFSRVTGQEDMPASTFGDCRENELRPWHELSYGAKTFASQDNEDAHGRIRKSAVSINSDLEQFVGRGHYYGKVDVARLEEGRRYYFRAEHVCDTFRVKVNGVEADFPDQVKKETDITRLLQEGENVLEVTVTSNLYNKVVGAAKDEADFVFQTVMPFTQKSYGMWGKCGIEIR